MKALPFTYCVKGRHWYFRHHKTGRVALGSEVGTEQFLETYRALLDLAGAEVSEGLIGRIIADQLSEAQTGLVYFIGWEGGPVKIGVASDTVTRLRTLQTACPYPLKTLAISGGGILRERAYHRRFAASRLEGEWFARTPELEDEIARLNVNAA